MHLFSKNEPSVIILSTVVAFAIATIYCVVGLTFFRKGSVENQIAGAVMLGNPNNILVIVFSSEFFGPVEPLVAAMYTIPFWMIVIPLRYYHHRMKQIA
jgi:BASS family bile acid:Na+ symporter